MSVSNTAHSVLEGTSH